MYKFQKKKSIIDYTIFFLNGDMYGTKYTEMELIITTIVLCQKQIV